MYDFVIYLLIIIRVADWPSGDGNWGLPEKYGEIIDNRDFRLVRMMLDLPDVEKKLPGKEVEKEVQKIPGICLGDGKDETDDTMVTFVLITLSFCITASLVLRSIHISHVPSYFVFPW